MNYQIKIGKAIIKLRNAKGISQEKMALESKIDRRYMSDIENGKRNISLDILCKIADYFDLPLSDFMARVEDTTNYDDNNDTLKEWLSDQGYENSVVLESPSYRNAIIGISEEGRVIYSARIILQDMVIDEGMEYEDAIDHFNYNLLRSLPYMGEMAPIIQYDISI
jgi:transcriptional regulator with XRE-family HTH domain